MHENFAKRLPRYPLLPATLLGHLAVHRSCQGKGLGELLIINALKRALNVTSQVASLAVVAEALDGMAVNFYQKYGFQRFKQYPMKLYLPMKTIEELCQTVDI